MSAHFLRRMSLKEGLKMGCFMSALGGITLGSSSYAWTLPAVAYAALNNPADYQDPMVLEEKGAELSLKNFSFDWDLKIHPEESLGLHHQWMNPYGNGWGGGESTLTDPFLGGENILNPSPMYREEKSYKAFPSPSLMRFSAGYQRTQCFVSLGLNPKDDGLGLQQSPGIATGFGVRYQWSDALAFEVGTVLHLNQQPKGQGKRTENPEPISDFTEQVNNLSKPMKSSFAEGLFTIVYHFCNPN